MLVIINGQMCEATVTNSSLAGFPVFELNFIQNGCAKTQCVNEVVNREYVEKRLAKTKELLKNKEAIMALRGRETLQLDGFVFRNDSAYCLNVGMDISLTFMDQYIYPNYSAYSGSSVYPIYGGFPVYDRERDHQVFWQSTNRWEFVEFMANEGLPSILKMFDAEEAKF